MTKRNLAMRISAETSIACPDVLLVVQTLFDRLTEGLVAGERFEFRDFGVFETTTRKSRVGRNPRKPASPVIIPERRVVKFKPGKNMRELVLRTKALNK